MAQCDTQALLSAANCFQCLPPGTLQVVQTSLLCKIWQGQNPANVCDIQKLLADAQCLNCLHPPQLQVLAVALLCNILQAGSVGTASCVLCGSGAPTTTPPCPCAIFYDSDSASPTFLSEWIWDATDAQWIQISGGP